MTGHHPWETHLKRLSAERRDAIAAGAATIHADIELRKHDLSGSAGNRRRRPRPLHDNTDSATHQDRRQLRGTASTR